jgi:hypothetical protein
MLRALALLTLALAAPAAADTVRTEAASLRYALPGAWTRVPAPSDMRAAQYTIPRAGGDTEDGEMILFFFGESKGGGVDDNLERWYGQFTQPDGKPSRDAAVLTIHTVKGLRVTAVDLSGTYAGMQAPGAAKSAPKPGFRMLAAVIEGKGGPWFFKAVGPTATLAQAKPDFDKLLDSLDVHR